MPTAAAVRHLASVRQRTLMHTALAATVGACLGAVAMHLGTSSIGLRVSIGLVLAVLFAWTSRPLQISLTTSELIVSEGFGGPVRHLSVGRLMVNEGAGYSVGLTDAGSGESVDLSCWFLRTRELRRQLGQALLVAGQGPREGASRWAWRRLGVKLPLPCKWALRGRLRYRLPSVT